MAGASNYLELALLDHALKGTSWAQPANVYVSLHSADTVETGAGEITAGANAYARQSASAAFAAAAAGAKATSADLTWTNMPATTITHVCIWDSVTGGNPLFLGSLTASKVVNAGDTFKILSTNLTVTMD
jgi:hypothetical protein